MDHRQSTAEAPIDARDLRPVSDEYQVMTIEGRKVKVPLGVSPAEIEEIRRTIRQEKMEQRLERITPEETQQRESKEMSEEPALHEGVALIGLLAFIGGLATAILYGLWLSWDMYGIVGLIGYLTVGGGFVCVTSIMLGTLAEKWL